MRTDGATWREAEETLLTRLWLEGELTELPFAEMLVVHLFLQDADLGMDAIGERVSTAASAHAQRVMGRRILNRALERLRAAARRDGLI